jgi:hypothetical protein
MEVYHLSGGRPLYLLTVQRLREGPSGEIQ